MPKGAGGYPGAGGPRRAGWGRVLGLPALTPDTQVLPLHGFRLDLGVLKVLQRTSLRSHRSGDLWGPYLALT